MKQRVLFIFLALLLTGVGWFALTKVDLRPASDVSVTLPSGATDSPQAGAKISGIVVPHHDLVKAQRAALFADLDKQIAEPKTVILVSPNHYETGQGQIQTTAQTWDTSKGAIAPNTAVISRLIGSSLVSDEPTGFTNEHGIRLVLGDIKNTFPNATIVPLILKAKTPQASIDKLHTLLKESCGDCLMIASVDFSHYQPALLANLHDNLTERALKNLDTTLLLTRAEVDSPAALALLVEWAQSHNTKKFVLKNRTNSGELAKDTDGETTTHFFGWYEGGEQAVAETSVSFMIGGDMMFGRGIAHKFLKDGLPLVLDKIGTRLFWGTDAGIVNLEGPVSDVPVPDDIRLNNLSFNFPPETIDALKAIKVNVASLANNHSDNRGVQGLATTRRLLTEANIQPVGGPKSSDASQVVTIEGNGLTLSVVGINAVFTMPDIVPVIKELETKPNNRILVFPHWGHEYIYNHHSSQAQLAHAWIDAGADVVIGAHPHVIQDAELYKGKPIIYSLGNFIFDQTFSLETQQGFFMAGQFTDKELQLFALPLQATKYKPALLTGDAKSALINRLYTAFAPQKKSTPAGDLLLFPQQ